MGKKKKKKELEAFQVLSPFSPFPLNGTKTILRETVQNIFVLLEHLISKAKYFRITARGFIHAISQAPHCAVSPFKSLPFLHCIKSKASFKNSSERPDQVPKLARSILYSLEQE